MNLSGKQSFLKAYKNMNTKEIKEINVIFWDIETNYNLPETQVQLGIIDGVSERFKHVYRFYDKTEFSNILSMLDDNDNVLILCHVDFKNNYNGYNKFEIFLEAYPNIRREVVYVSSNKYAHKDFIEKQSQKISIMAYSEISEKLKAETILPRKKINIVNLEAFENVSLKSTIPSQPHIKYAVITALYDNEFEEVEKIFDFEEDDIRTGTTIYKVGKLKNTDIKVVTSFATKTGMIEASIIATEMINMFTPKYIFMPGVCGGANSTKFGSVIVAEKVFIFQKGKVSDLKEITDNGIQKTKLFYNKKEFDKRKLTNSDGEKINIIIEKFEHESEVIEIDTELSTLLKPILKSIKNKINEPYKLESEKIEVQLESMACSMMVINKEDYFDDTILPIDRKTKAVEMESYGVARAAKVANGGKTKFLIFKSVMDKTQLKDDDYKKKAAYTSAQFLKHLLESKVL